MKLLLVMKIADETGKPGHLLLTVTSLHSFTFSHFSGLKKFLTYDSIGLISAAELDGTACAVHEILVTRRSNSKLKLL